MSSSTRSRLNGSPGPLMLISRDTQSGSSCKRSTVGCGTECCLKARCGTGLKGWRSLDDRAPTLSRAYEKRHPAPRQLSISNVTWAKVSVPRRESPDHLGTRAQSWAQACGAGDSRARQGPRIVMRTMPWRTCRTPPNGARPRRRVTTRGLAERRLEWCSRTAGDRRGVDDWGSRAGKEWVETSPTRRTPACAVHRARCRPLT